MRNSITFEKLPLLVKDLIGEVEALREMIVTLRDDNSGISKKEYLNVYEIADLLGLSKSSIYAKVSKRELPHIKRGKRLYFLREDISEYLNSKRVATLEELEGSASIKVRGGSFE